MSTFKMVGIKVLIWNIIYKKANTKDYFFALEGFLFVLKVK